MTTTKFTNAAIIIIILLLLVIPATAEFKVTGISPATGVNKTVLNFVTVTGTEFPVDATRVVLNKTGQDNITASGIDVRWDSATQMSCNLDLTGKQWGLWNVSVANTTNWSVPKVDGFTITTLAPTITNATPADGVNIYPALPVKITGSNFLQGARVNVTNATASPNMFNADTVVVNPAGTEITCTLNLTTRIGAWQIFVNNTDGQITSPGFPFTIYNPAPTITSVSPPTGITANSNLGVTIYGSNFIDGATVNYTQGTNYIPKLLTNGWKNSGQIDTYGLDLTSVPVGYYNVTVSNPGALYNNTTSYSAFQVFYPAPPVVSNIIPSTGNNTENFVTVQIVGSGFQGSATVNLTRSTYTNITGTVTSYNLTTINCTLPILGKTAGPWNVVVTNNDTQSSNPDVQFTIIAPPASITNLHNTTYLPTSITWAWTDPTSTDFNHVKVYLDGTFKENVAKGNQAYTASSLTPGTQHTISTHTVGETGLVNQTWVNLTNWTSPVATPVTNFTGTPRSGTSASLNVQFNDTSTGTDIASYQWIFGDSATVYPTQNLTHAFAPGTWNVNHSATNSVGTVWKNETGYIIVTAPVDPPVVNFTGTPRSGTTTSLNVQFNDTSTGTDITSYQWIFGDSATVYPTQNLTHAFAPGIWNVNHSATNSAGTIWKNETGYIIVTAPVDPPVANFTGTPRSGTTTSLNVQFNDTSTGTGLASYQWIFGDSATVYLTQNLTHAFAPGTWNVNHSVTNSTGTTVWKNETGYITVTAPVDPPVANFIGTPRSGTTTSLNVQFNDTSTGTGLASYQWIFGDNATVYTTQNLTHAFAPGTWNVNHSVTNSTGTKVWKNETGYIIVTAPPFPPIANFTATTTAGFKPLLVQFNDTSVSGITEWKWTLIGDEVIYLNKNPLYTYNEVGNYTVKLKVWNATGDDKITKNDYIIVTNRPVADFTANPTNGTAPMDVTFTDTSQYATGWLWTFGDGSNSTQQNPSHRYTTVGVKEVTLRVFNAGGEGTPKTKTVTVRNACPVANFTATPTKGDVSLNVQFTDTSTGTITGRNWDFGDGGTSTLTNPLHTYVTPGVYQVRLEVYNLDCSNTTTKQNLINATQPKPVADFTGSPANGTTKVTLFSFYDLSTNNPTSWLWNFGDGATSTLKNPTHIYQTSDQYYVTLISSNAGGASVPKIRGPIPVTNPAPVANFTGTPRLGTLPLTVQFTDTSSGMPTAWIWDFGDSTIGTGPNPVHTYSQAGSYTVFMTAIDSTTGLSNTTLPRVAYITVTKTPFAGFTASPTSGSSPLVVRFTDQSQGNPFRFYWKFGDGTFSNARNPTHVYQKPGNYTVTLTVQSLSGYNTVIKQNLVTVSQLPQASFNVNATSGIKPKTIRFTDTSTAVPNPNSWTWDFGDASTGPERFVKSPDHTYVSQGVYSVQLTVSNGFNSSTVTKPSLITISTTTGAEFTFKPVEGDVPLAIQFTDQSTGDPTSYRWQFGDGSVISREKNPIHTYTKPGNYTVTLSITTRTGTTSSVSHELVLTGKPTASFTANPTAGSNPLTVQFTDTSSNNPTYYFWNYGDGTFGNEIRNPSHTYNSPGTFNVTLYVTNQYDPIGDTSTPTQIKVSQFP